MRVYVNNSVSKSVTNEFGDRFDSDELSRIEVARDYDKNFLSDIDGRYQTEYISLSHHDAKKILDFLK